MGSCRGVRDVLIDAASVAERARETYEVQHVRLWRAVAVWSGSTDVADEAVAEAFAQLLRRGDEVLDPASWVWRTAFRLAAAELKRRPTGEPAEPIVTLPLNESDLAIDLVRAMRHLSPQQRACIVLCDLLGYAAEEAGDLLDTSAAAVRVQRMRARRRLRTLLEVNDG
jgi:RNA polymerase sigma-70 factor (ECF subfamily)